MQHPAIDSSWQHGYETITPAANGFTTYTLTPLPYERIILGWHFMISGEREDEAGVSPQARAELIVSDRIVAQQPLRELLLPSGLELFMCEVRERLSWLENEVRALRDAFRGETLREEEEPHRVYPGELSIPLYIRKNRRLQVRIHNVPEHLWISAVLRGVVKPPEV